VKVDKVESSAERTLITYRQILVKTDPDTRHMPADVREAAEKKAREKIDAAKKRLDAGEPFSVVGNDTGIEDDAKSKGEAFDADWTSPFVRTALRQTLDEVTAPVEIKEPSGTTWHLFACSRDKDERSRTWEQKPRANRVVQHMAFASKEDADKAKAKLDAVLKERETQRGAPAAWPDVVKEFKKIAKKASSAPTKVKGGAFGHVELDAYVRAFGDVFLEKVAETKTGSRSEVFRGETGYHIIEVLPHEVKPEETFDRDRRVADTILRGTDWE
jgi:hypothetical protein